MILQALADYYYRKRKESNSLPPIGYQRKAINFIIVIDEAGELVNIEDTREVVGSKKIAESFFVPSAVDRTGKNAWQTAFLLWDHPRYVFAVPQSNDADEIPQKRYLSFINRLFQSFPEPQVDAGVNSVVRFLQNGFPISVKEHPLWNEILITTGNVSFRLRGDSERLICQRPYVLTIVQREIENIDAPQGFCPVSGEIAPIAKLHIATPLPVSDSKSTAKLVSFNEDAYESYGKEKSFNAPVSCKSVLAYTNALNYLLYRGSRQRLQIGDASTVFWAEKGSPLEDDFVTIFGESAKSDDPDRNTRKVRELYRAVETGGYTEGDDANRFYVLGLAPNAARISVRFWEVATVRELSKRIKQHFDDLTIAHAPYESPYPSLFRLLVHTAVQGKADNIPSNLGGEFMRAVLTGGLYPQTLLQAAVRRNRAERTIDYYRAALIKAVLNRQHRTHHNMEKEISVALDPENTDNGYRLGRLFAVLERIQQEAQGDINATIRDKFYGSASSSPRSVFSNLIKLKNHHLAKIKTEKPGLVTYYENLVGQIIDELKQFPAQMTLAEQGLFAIGYYHQRQDFFKGKQTQEKGE